MSGNEATTAAREQLAEAVAQMADSETFGAWLRARGAFRDYSLNNCLLIATQRPDASQVAGYKAWQKLGRQVRKGEHGIRILAPMGGKVADEKTGDTTYRVFGFRVVSVFDIGQTDGDPLPELEYRPLEGDAPAGMVETLAQVAANVGLRIEYRTLELAGAHGYLRRSKSLIVVDVDQAPAMRAKVLAHELGHFFDPMLTETPDLYREHRGDCEAVAESVAYVIAHAFGCDAGPSAIGYVCSWTDGDAQRVADLAARIDAATASILGRGREVKAA